MLYCTLFTSSLAGEFTRTGEVSSLEYRHLLGVVVIPVSSLLEMDDGCFEGEFDVMALRERRSGLTPFNAG